MKNNQYYYAVTRIHNYEQNLLSGQSIETMRQTDTVSGCVNVLKEHGWAADENMPVHEIIEKQQEKIWSFLGELTDSSGVLDLFRYEHDFENIKAIIRLHYTQKAHESNERYLSGFGTLPVQTLKDCGASGSFDRLAEMFSAPANEANKLLLQTGSGQLADAVLDKACLEVLHAEADRRNSAILKQYVETKADVANIMIAVRGLKMNKSDDFFRIAMADSGSLSRQELCSAVSRGADAVYAYIDSTKYADCLDMLKSSISYFQAEVEGKLIDAIKPQKYAIGGIDAIYAFVIAMENELKLVRLLLSAKLNHFSADFVDGCLRRTYA